MKFQFMANLPDNFHKSIGSPIKTMESMKKGIRASSSVIYNKVMALPPTTPNLHLHILRTHHAVILGKAADKSHPPKLVLTQFGREIKDGIPIPAISKKPAGPQELIDVIACNCTAAGKACRANKCSCHRERLPCTAYCKCNCLDGYNPFKGSQTEEEDDDYEQGQDDNFLEEWM